MLASPLARRAPPAAMWLPPPAPACPCSLALPTAFSRAAPFSLHLSAAVSLLLLPFPQNLASNTLSQMNCEWPSMTGAHSLGAEGSTALLCWLAAQL